MSTNNISQKQIFSYLVSTLSYWGIKSVNQQTFKSAKKNLPSAIKQMKRAVFNLILLHMFDYKIKLNDYIGSDVKEQEIDEVIMAYLAESECPLLLQMKNRSQNPSKQSQEGQNDVQFYVGCNLESSRNLLIIFGWVMAISDYFNQILPNAIHQRLNSIQNPQLSLKAVESLIQNKLNHLNNSSSKTQSQAEQISSLYKSIKAHMYQTQCYKQKRTKLKSRLQNTLQKLLNTSIPFDFLLRGTNSDKQSKKQAQLQQIIENQIENMKQRKYFWIWLQEKILKQTQAQVKQNNQIYQALQADQNSILYETQIDLQYLSKYSYIQLCQYYEQKYDEMSQRMSNLKPTNKRFQDIQNEVNHEFKQTLSQKTISMNKKHLFIALQLKAHLKINLQKPKVSKQSKSQNQIKNQRNQNYQMSKKYKKQIKKYLQSIEDSIKFI